MFAPTPAPLLTHHQPGPVMHADSSALYALSASEALTSLLQSLPPLPTGHSNVGLHSVRHGSDSLTSCKIEEISITDEVDDGRRSSRRGGGAGSSSSSSASKTNRPPSSSGYSQASKSTASSQSDYLSTPSPVAAAARSGPITLEFATASNPPASYLPTTAVAAPTLPSQTAAATSLASILDPHLLHLLYLYSSRSLSPFNENGVWSCFLSHLQQPDPNNPGHRLPLCDKQYQRSSRRSFKNHVWKCLCRHFPSIAKFTYPEFRRLCTTDRTVMAGFHAVTLFPRPQKKRRSTAELTDGERWLCPHGCGQEYRNTSSTSIGRHLRKECRLRDKSEEEKDEERRTLKLHEREVQAYRALKAAATAPAEMQTRDCGDADDSPVAMDFHMPDIKRVRLSSEPTASTVSASLLRLPPSPTLFAAVSAAAQKFSASATAPLPSTAREMQPLVAAIALPASAEAKPDLKTVQEQSAGAGNSGGGAPVRIMSTAEIAMLEAQLMETIQTQMVVDKLLADRMLADLTVRAEATVAVSNHDRSGGGPVPRANSGGGVALADDMNGWHRSNSGNDGAGATSDESPVAAALGPFTPPHFVSMSNAPSPSPLNLRQLQQRPIDNSSVNRRLEAMQAAAYAMQPTAVPQTATGGPDRQTSLNRIASSAATYTVDHRAAVSSSSPPPYPQLTSEETTAVIRQQLSLRCVSFLSQPGRDVQQLPSALLQVVAGLPVGLGTTLVQETLRALELSGRSGSFGTAPQQHAERSSASTPGLMGASSASTPSQTISNYQSPTLLSAYSSPSMSVPTYQNTSAASILLSPLSLFEPHRNPFSTHQTPQHEAAHNTASTASSPAFFAPPPKSHTASPRPPALLPLSSSPPPLRQKPNSSTSHLHDWLSALPPATAAMYRQRLATAATQPLAMYDMGSPRNEVGGGGGAPMAAPRPPVQQAHTQAAPLAAQQKLLHLATSRGAPSGRVHARPSHSGHM